MAIMLISNIRRRNGDSEFGGLVFEKRLANCLGKVFVGINFVLRAKLIDHRIHKAVYANFLYAEMPPAKITEKILAAVSLAILLPFAIFR
jgi:hypothetical protein